MKGDGVGARRGRWRCHRARGRPRSAASNWPTNPGVSWTEMPITRMPCSSSAPREADRDVERREGHVEREAHSPARGPATRRPRRPGAPGERSAASPCRIPSIRPTIRSASAAGGQQPAHQPLRRQRKRDDEHAPRAAPRRRSCRPPAPRGRPRRRRPTTSGGRSEASSAERRAAPTTVSPSKMRSTATEESAAVNRTPDEPRGGEAARTSSPARKGRMLLAMNPMAMACQSGLAGSGPPIVVPQQEPPADQADGKVRVARTTRERAAGQGSRVPDVAHHLGRGGRREAPRAAAPTARTTPTSPARIRASADRPGAALRIRQARAGRGRAAPAAAAGWSSRSALPGELGGELAGARRRRAPARPGRGSRGTRSRR